MCGIAGWIGAGCGEDHLQAMSGKIVHRGPDGDGHIVLELPKGRKAAFAHRRLSIIDLATGGQPMRSHDGRFTIAFNGEIYNYPELRAELSASGSHFATASDTEVILEAWRRWGEDSLQRFRGMFAFALHDSANQEVILARDPFGKKPLYIASYTNADGKGLAFGSEISAVLEHPDVAAELDTQSLFEFLNWRYVPGPNTFFRGITKLVPGGMIRWRDGAWAESRYRLAPEEEGAPRLPEPADPVGAFLEVFDQAVRIRMRSDVPLGAFLSSGLDSASIVATMAHLGIENIRTFSVGFRGDAGAELPGAAATARHIGTVHTPIELDTDQIVDLLPALSRLRGAPMAETADMPIYVMSLEAAKSVKVVLSGEGADELFGGYPKHLAEKYLGAAAGTGLPSLAARGFLAAQTVLPASAKRLTIAARALGEPCFEGRMVQWFGSLTRAERAALWTGPAHTRALRPIPFNARKGASSLRRVLHFDQTSWLPDNLLERMDTMTMAASIEARAPFMDIRLAEFAASLPDNWRIRGGVTKRIVREALHSRLPGEVINRPKNGFRLPVAEWFRGDLREPFNDLLLGPGSVSAAYLDGAEIRRIAGNHVSGKQDHAKTLWSLFALETFLREFF